MRYEYRLSCVARVDPAQVLPLYTIVLSKKRVRREGYRKEPQCGEPNQGTAVNAARATLDFKLKYYLSRGKIKLNVW